MRKRTGRVWRTWFAAAGLVLSLAACDTPQPIDISRAELMPEAAAKKIIASWVPTYNGGDFLYVDGEPIRIKSMKNLYYLSSTEKLMLPKPRPFTADGFICSISLDEAKRFVEALTILGASAALFRNAAPGFAALASCSLVRGSP